MKSKLVKIIIPFICASVLVGCAGVGGNTGSGDQTSESGAGVSADPQPAQTEMLQPETSDVSGTEAGTSTNETGDSGSLDSYYQTLSNTIQKDASQYGFDTANLSQTLGKLKEINKKASAYCGDSYLAEKTVDNKGPIKILVRYYVANGSARSEEYHDGNIAYVEVYNGDTDTYSTYDAAQKKNEVLPNASSQGMNRGDLVNGYFQVFANNAALGTISETELDGKKAVLSTFSADGMDNKTWMDAENGIMLKTEQSSDGGVFYEENATVTPGVTFDKSLFELDKNKLDAGKDIK